jgi:putative endonuclease
MTNDLIRRVFEHRSKSIPGFTAKYNITQLAYYENYPTAMGAIEREKQIKGWKRDKKIALIEKTNPRREDLGDTLKERFPVAVNPMAFRRDAVSEVQDQILRCAQNDGLAPSESKRF